MIFFFSKSFNSGKAFFKLDFEILLDLNIGPRKLKIIHDKIDENFKHNNLQMINKNIIIKD